ncbi:MAG: helix-turn-helix transcriptional regulator, partial [Trichodesmium sp. St2_bin2_1]|nr:helix-turn-helix transcriptional regulator [Trichodesmium sp. St2_bin2_1]
IFCIFISFDINYNSYKRHPISIMKKYEFSYIDITILNSLSDGLSDNQIKEILYLSVRSIKRHISKLMKIFNCLNRCHLVAKYQKHLFEDARQ